MHQLTGLLGILVLMGLAYAASTDRRAIRIKTVAWGLGLQIVFAFLVLKFEYGRRIFEHAGEAVKWLLSFSYEGSKFVFGQLGAKEQPLGFYFAFMVLPTIIFIAAFFAILYHFGVMQFIIKCASR